jgi:hypothetical protein
MTEVPALQPFTPREHLQPWRGILPLLFPKEPVQASYSPTVPPAEAGTTYSTPVPEAEPAIPFRCQPPG